MRIDFSSITKQKLGGRIRGRRTPDAIMEEVLRKELSLDVEYFKRRMSGPTSSGYLSPKTGEMRRNTFLEVSKTSKGNVTARIYIGKGVPYTSIHVGTEGGVKTYVSRKKKFTIPMDWIQKKDGTWRSPFRPGHLKDVKGLFKKEGDADHLFYRDSSGNVRLAFKLQPSIKIPQRINVAEEMNKRKDTLARSMAEAFGGFDFSYVTMVIR